MGPATMPAPKIKTFFISSTSFCPDMWVKLLYPFPFFLLKIVKVVNFFEQKLIYDLLKTSFFEKK